MKKYGFEITGHLDVFVGDYEEDDEGEILKWQEVLIHGDPDGLRSFGKLLIKLANLDQEKEQTFRLEQKSTIIYGRTWN